MIHNFTQGTSFAGAARYVLGKSEGERVAGNMAGRTVRELDAEWQVFRGLNDNIQKDVYHASLSAAADDELTATQWGEIAERYIEEMDFSESAWLAVRHRDTEHDHIHILANRVNVHGKGVDIWQCKKRGEEVCHAVEREYGLRELVPSWEREQRRRGVSSAERSMMERTGEKSVKVSMQDVVDTVSRDVDELGAYLRRLREQDIYVECRRREDGTPYGITYVRGEDEARMKGSDLGRAFSWGGLQKKAGLSYEAGRDGQELERSEWRDGVARDEERARRESLGEVVSVAAHEAETISEYVAALGEGDVTLEVEEEDEKIVELEYVRGADQTRMRASYLGEAYSWEGLQEQQGIEYEPGRDGRALGRGGDARGSELRGADASRHIATRGRQRQENPPETGTGLGEGSGGRIVERRAGGAAQKSGPSDGSAQPDLDTGRPGARINRDAGGDTSGRGGRDVRAGAHQPDDALDRGPESGGGAARGDTQTPRGQARADGGHAFDDGAGVRSDEQEHRGHRGTIDQDGRTARAVHSDDREAGSEDELAVGSASGRDSGRSVSDRSGGAGISEPAGAGMGDGHGDQDRDVAGEHREQDSQLRQAPEALQQPRRRDAEGGRRGDGVDSPRAQRRRGRRRQKRGRSDEVAAQAKAAERKLAAGRAARKWKAGQIDDQRAAGLRQVERGAFDGEVVACRAAEGGSFVVVADHERNQFAVFATEARVAERLEPDDQIEITLKPGHVYAPDEFKARRYPAASKDKAKEQELDRDGGFER